MHVLLLTPPLPPPPLPAMSRPSLTTGPPWGQSSLNLSLRASSVNREGLDLNHAYEAAVQAREVLALPHGSVAADTAAAGPVKLSIPSETIKDSMRPGLPIPAVYIVPVERFCRELGPALGVNLVDVEFPACFNFFVQRIRCMLVIDSGKAERNIRGVFSETLLGPTQLQSEGKAGK